MKAAPSNYRHLAAFYDRFFTVRLAIWRRARRRLLKSRLHRIASMCDLACGTGETALEFARRGARVYALDLSAEMCRITRQKARREGLPVRVRRADMRNFRLPEPVELVTLEFNALNHLPDRADLGRVLAAVHRGLLPDGLFIFDVNHRITFERHWTQGSVESRPGLLLVMRGGYDRARGKGWTDAIWFARGKGGRRKHFRDRIEEVAWTRRELRAALRKAGFKVEREMDGRLLFPKPSHALPGYKTLYLARREPGGSLRGI